jgi:ABC-type multidrug transport system ATPase subunit
MKEDLLLSIRDISKSFGRRKILDNISFDIQKGKITGFLGPNGAGKTTTIKLLLGLIKKDTGQIELNGKEIQDVKNLRFNIIIGSLMEFPSFYSNLTARENLKILSLSDNYQIDEKRIDYLLNLVDLKNGKDRQIKTFSFGMKQKLAIADALLNDPELLILDEPFTGLDPNSIDSLNKILKNFVKNNGTIFVSSHILSEVEDLCYWIILINKGKIIHQGELKPLISQKSLKEIYLKFTKDENI